jgi:hypothetical protein
MSDGGIGFRIARTKFCTVARRNSKRLAGKVSSFSLTAKAPT